MNTKRRRGLGLLHVNSSFVDTDNFYRRFFIDESVGRLYLDDVSVEVGITYQGQAGNTYAFVTWFQSIPSKGEGR